MAPRKRKLQQRIKAVGEQIEASIREDAELQKLEFVASDELFQIDTAGGKLTKKQKLHQKDPVVKSNKFIAEKANKFEAELVKKLAQREQPKRAAKANKTVAGGPLWGSDGAVAVDKKIKELDPYVAPAVVKKVAAPSRVASTRHRIKKVAVPAPGQSYHPDFASHQDVLAEALAQELEKQALREEQSKPVSGGLSEETLQFIKENSDDDDEDSDDEEDGSHMRRREKLTIPQRNKRARHRQMEMEHKAKRTEKSLLKQINTSKHILQDILKEEKMSEQKKELKKVIAEQKLDEEPMVKVGRQMTKIVRDTPVLLSDELTGSLRKLKPKGDPLLDRFDSLHKRNMIVANHSRAKGKKKVKIVPVKNEGIESGLTVTRLAAHASICCCAMPSSMMRPGNFRHDVRGAGVVEVSMAEYLRSKRSILKKIRRRLIMLGIIIGLTALVSFLLGVIVATAHDKIVKFHRKSFEVSLRDLYFVYGGVALLFSFHGFYVDGHWASMQKDGNRLVLHLRLYSFIGLASCVAAVWLGFGTLSAFGLVDVRYIIDSPINTIYLVTLVDLCVHLIVTPWLLRTVHRKANQADEYFGAEFVDSVKRSQRSERSARDRDDDKRDGEDQEGEENDDGNDESEEERRDRRAVVVPASSPRDRIAGKNGTTPRSPTKSRHAFYGPDGSSRVVGTSVSVRQSTQSPRLNNRDLSSQAVSPRPAANSPRLSIREVGIPHSEYGLAADAGTSAAASALPHSDHIPYASPVFLLDSQPRLQSGEFWRLWKVSETTGSFSCPFTNHPHRDDVKTHLQTFGFHVIAVEAKDNALQVYFYAFQLSTDTFFLGEFVLLFARQFFQATFKCKEHDAAPDFVARFNLQELLVATDDS